jgi:hypothetical protein
MRYKGFEGGCGSFMTAYIFGPSRDSHYNLPNFFDDKRVDTTEYGDQGGNECAVSWRCPLQAERVAPITQVVRIRDWKHHLVLLGSHVESGRVPSRVPVEEYWPGCPVRGHK